jgi:hypothetical protein
VRTLKHNNKDLIQDGWMTIDEFMEKLTPSLTEYLKSNWGMSGKDDIHHPTDLFTTASIYMEIAYRVANDFLNCRHD